MTRVVATAATLALVVVWALLLRPQLLGGPAAYVIVSGKSMEPALLNGDLVVALKKSSYDVGDVVAYRVPQGDPGAGSLVIHRVIGGSATAGYVTQGDNREGRDLWEPKPRDVFGSMSLRIPRVGLVLAFVQTPLGIAISAAVATFLFVSAGSRKGGRPDLALHRRSVPPRLAVTPLSPVASPLPDPLPSDGEATPRGVRPPPGQRPPRRRNLF